MVGDRSIKSSVGKGKRNTSGTNCMICIKFLLFKLTIVITN